MASSFKNASHTISTADTDETMYTANQANQVAAIIHGLYIANKHATSNVQITLKVYDNSATSDMVILSKVPIPPNTTLSLDKSINLEADDSLKVAATHTDCEIFASVLERS
jgi:hypothetical protein|tara:strand:- start:1534 stop:1866 length:333 start_codon:yes stop_codon:yes gene_type:complete